MSPAKLTPHSFNVATVATRSSTSRLRNGFRAPSYFDWVTRLRSGAWTKLVSRIIVTGEKWRC